MRCVDINLKKRLEILLESILKRLQQIIPEEIKLKTMEKYVTQINANCVVDGELIKKAIMSKGLIFA